MKTCKEEGCNNNNFSKGYCRYHWGMHYVKPIRRSKISSVRGTKIKKRPLKALKKATGEKELFLRIYMEKQYNWVSQLSGIPLPRPDQSFFIHSFAHILAKGKYPKYRLKMHNIFLLTSVEHVLFDQGTVERREQYAIDKGLGKDAWEVLYLLTESLKKEYNEK